jgi:hypothetical protein
MRKGGKSATRKLEDEVRKSTTNELEDGVRKSVTR